MDTIVPNVPKLILQHFFFLSLQATQSKVYLNIDDSPQPIIGIWAANKNHFSDQLNGLQGAIQELLVEPSTDQVGDSAEDFSTSFQSALWQIAAVIWQHNSSPQNEQYAIQSKLF